MSEKIPVQSLAHYAKYGGESAWKRIGNLLIVFYAYFYFPFLAVWYLFLRYIVTAYGNALVQGHPLNNAWSYFFSNAPDKTLSATASAFMGTADKFVLAPISWPFKLLYSAVGAGNLWNGIGIILIVAFFGLLFVAIPYRMFGFFQKLMRNTLDKG